MDPTRWHEVEALFQAALEREPSTRSAFLEEMCASDPELRQEVESLLRVHADASGYLEPPALRAQPSGEFELRERLTAALAGRYTIERELGGGGMSRVFVARETALGRRVVVKLLPPGLPAELDAERFRREIRLAASLQHPHIVPVHSAGQADDLLYYTMPFVEGESLKQRLDREGVLPVTEAVRLLREIADALCYAHRRGIIHRDLKPANILTAENHALVADFGIAKALAAASGGTSAVATLTSTGLILGTPAYMAPEQAAGDETDHRVDLYALGCLAYELLTRQPPFVRDSAQALIAAQIADQPQSLTQRRTGIPPALDALVLRLLAKRPAERPQTAEQVVQELDEVTLHQRRLPLIAVLGIYVACASVVLGLAYLAMVQLGLPDWVLPGAALLLLVGLPIIVATALLQTGSLLHLGDSRLAARRISLHWLTWRRAISGGVLSFAGLGASVAGYMAMREFGVGPVGTLLASGVLSQRERVLLAGFQTPARDTLLGAAVTDAFRVDFAQSKHISLVPPERIAQVLERMRRPPTARLDIALAREVALRAGVRTIVTGELTPAGTGLLVSAKLISAANGEVLAAHRETAYDSTEIIRAIDRLSRQVRARIGESLKSLRSERPLEEVTTASLPALQKFSEAVRAGDFDGDHAKGVLLLKDAVALDTGFASAYAALGIYLGILGERQQQVDALTKAFLHSERLPDRERYVSRARYYSEVTYELDKAVNGYRAHLGTYPTDSIALVNLALIYSDLRQYERAEELLRRAIALDSALYPAHLNLITVQVALGRQAAAELTFEQAARLFPDNPYVKWWGVVLAVFGGDYRSALARARTLKARHSETALFRAMASDQLAVVATLRGKLAEAEGHWHEAMDAYAEVGSTQPYFAAGIALGLLTVWVRQEPSRGLGEVERALSRYPLDSLKLLDRPYLPLSVAYAAAGNPQRARTLLAEYEHVIEPRLRRLDDPGRHRAGGYVALAVGDHKSAIGEFRSYITSVGGYCRNCGLRELAYAYDRSGAPDSAIAVYERYLKTPSLGYAFIEDLAVLPIIFERLGQLYLQRGDQLAARGYYKRFVALWEDCDAALRPRVVEARKRLAKLSEEDVVRDSRDRQPASTPSR
jgi:serine/threonine-protein kinase